MPENTDTAPPRNDTPALCPGRCNAGWRAAERRYYADGTDHTLEPWPGQPVWCPPCTTAIRAAIADMPELAVRLVLEVDSGVAAALSEYVSGSKERRLHEHEAAAFALEDLATFIGDWDDYTRRDRNLPSTRNHTLDHAHTVAASSRFLLIHLDWILTQHPGDHDVTGADVAEGFGIELLALYRRVQNLTSAQDVEPVRIAGVPCTNCDRMTLEHEVDDAGKQTGYIRCRRCKPTVRLAPDEYHQWTRLIAAGDKARALATPERLAEIFGNSVPTQYKAVR